MLNNVIVSFIKFGFCKYLMRKILAIIGAIITGGIGVAITTLPQSAEAIRALSQN
jgi:hypothetical protein